MKQIKKNLSKAKQIKKIPKAVNMAKLKDLKNKLPAKQDEDDDVYIVSLDIGTEYVKVISAEYDGDDLKIIGVGKAKQDPDAMTAGAVSDISKVVETCDAALIQAENMSKISPRRTVIGVAGELVKGRANTVTYKRADSEEEITDEEFEAIVGKIQEAAYDRAKAELTWETGTEDIDIKIVNSAVISIEIDGYKVTNPIGFQGKEVKIHVYNAFAPLVHVGALEKIASELDLELVTIAAEPYAVAKAVLGPQTNSELDAVFVDIGGGTTDVALVTEGGIDGTVMFAVGGRSFTKSIANKLDIDIDKAENTKRKFADNPNKYEGDKVQQVKDSINSTIDLWLQGLGIALEELADTNNIPNKILFCGGGSSLKPLRQSIQSKEWRKDLQLHKLPEPRLIGINNVKGLKSAIDRDLDYNYITAMGLLRVGIDTMTQDAVSKVQSRVNGLLKI